MESYFEVLLRDKPKAAKALAFVKLNPTFIPRVVSELRLVQRHGQRAGGLHAVAAYLRATETWNGVDEFEISENLLALFSRVIILAYADTAGMLKAVRCDADDILGTTIRRKKDRYGSRILPGKRTLPAGYSFLRPRKDPSGEGLIRPILTPTGELFPPEVQVIPRELTAHEPITTEETTQTIKFIGGLIATSPRPRHRLLREWCRHVTAMPEIFVLMTRKLPAPGNYVSPCSLWNYVRWAVRRAASDKSKRFTLPNVLEGLYCRALVLFNRSHEGYARLKDSGYGNRLLGLDFAKEVRPGELFRRFVGVTPRRIEWLQERPRAD